MANPPFLSPTRVSNSVLIFTLARIMEISTLFLTGLTTFQAEFPLFYNLRQAGQTLIPADTGKRLQNKEFLATRVNPYI
ncbi:MAG: hypothetical protein BGO39_02005 [Chloroflexi bacterium 54-19]|nr:MAG: hypothetical protein BGO39_02005 [Chloroflexi bacterium 54-19]